MKHIQSILIMSLVLVSLLMPMSAAAEDTSSVVVSLVNQDPDPVSAGNVVELRLAVENRGGEPATDMIMELVPEYPFEAVNGESLTQELGTLKQYQTDEDSKIVKFKVRINQDASAGDYELKINIYDPTDSSVPRYQRSVDVEVNNANKAEIIAIDKVELLPGKIIPLTFTINNVGSSPLEDLTFYWENENGVVLPVGSDDTKYINYIPIDGSIDVVYDVVASLNAEPDLYKLKLYLTYDDPVTGSSSQTVTQAGVYVGGETDFDIAFSDSSNGEMSFSIANIGSVDARSVTLSIPNQQGWKVSGSNSVIIGNLNTGDYTVASFNLQSMQKAVVENEEEKSLSRMQQRETNELSIAVQYTDSRGERKTVTKALSLDASMTGNDAVVAGMGPGNRMKTQQQSSSNTWIYVGIGVVVVLLGIVAYTKHKKKMQEQEERIARLQRTTKKK